MKVGQTWNQQVVKKENKSLVLKTIIQKDPISRAEIATVTGLNKGTVSSLVNELLDEELIYESGPGESSGGRRPVILHFNQVAGYSIGIDVGVNYMLGILTDLKGNICLEKQIKLRSTELKSIKDQLCSMIDHLIDTAPKSRYGIVGIGVGVPGTVSKKGNILHAPNLNWKDVDLTPFLEEQYNVPILIENEANAGAYGEKKFGVGNGLDHIIYVSVGIGIGVGMILNGTLYKGSKGFSGELGHMSVNVFGDVCRCGNEGCWELYASEQALIKHAEKLQISVPEGEELTLEYMMELAEQGNEDAIRIFHNIGEYLGVGINNIINIFNPQEVIVGNRMAKAKKWIQEPLMEQLEKRVQSFHERGLLIKFSQLSSDSTALGAAAFSAENFLKVQI